MIIFGILFFLVGLLAGIFVLKFLGIVLFVIGIGFLVLGRTGHAVGGRSHYW